MDSATGQPVNGTVYVALEALQNSNYHTIASQQPDSSGNFDFKNVTANSSLILVVTAMNNQDLFDDFYVPYILAGSDNAPNGAGSAIKPGTNVGTLSISFAPGPDAEELDVAMQSSTSGGGAVPITVNFTATTFQLDRHIDFQLPFIPDPVTTQVNGPGCSAGTACATGKVYLPTSAPTIQYFQAMQIQGNPPSYAVFANATIPNSKTPDCQPPTQEMDLNADRPGQTVGTSLVFTGCQ